MGINEYLEARDVSSSDVAPFLFIHTLLSAALVGSTWYWCYLGSGRAPAPAQLFQNEEVPRSLLLNSLTSMPMVSDGIKRRACQALITLEKASRNSKPVKYLERKVPSLDATRVCVSYAEAKLGRLFLKPITVPGRIWLSWKGTKVWRQMMDGSDGGHGACLPKSSGTKGRKSMQLIDSTRIQPRSRAIFARECRGVRVDH